MAAAAGVKVCGRRLAATLAAISMLLGGHAAAAEWYVRVDGGDATRCSGRVDRSLAEAGAGDQCAWAHPFDALPPGAAPRIAGGDTLYIRSGDYRMGHGAPGTQHCARDYPWDCHMPPLPSGLSPQARTRVVGFDPDGRCRVAPRLWGAERAAKVINLEGSNHVELACLEVTDGAACAENHCHGGQCTTVAACPRERFPYGDWAGTGISARDSADVVLRDLDVHGLALRGIHAGRLRDWRLERVRLVGNGNAGWDGDLGADDSSNAGAMHFEQVEIAWNGCIEPHPAGQPFGCWGQSSGGYGDGLGTAASGGEWVFEQVEVHHNASDGLDLLYLRPEASVRVSGSRFASNAGNQLKTGTSARVADSRIEGDCASLREHGLPAPDLCRAGGDAVIFALSAATRVTLENSTLRGQGNCLVVADGGAPGSRVMLSGNRLRGAPSWQDADRQTCGFYAHGSRAAQVLTDNDFIAVRKAPCPDGNRCAVR